MASEVLIRRIALSGDFLDTDWLDPAVAVPDSIKRIRVVSSEITFAIVGKASTDADADVANVTGVTVDAYLASEVGGGLVRGQSLVEVEGGALDGRIKIKGSGLKTGEIVRLHLTLLGVGALAAADIYLVGGGRPL